MWFKCSYSFMNPRYWSYNFTFLHKFLSNKRNLLKAFSLDSPRSGRCCLNGNFTQYLPWLSLPWLFENKLSQSSSCVQRSGDGTDSVSQNLFNTNSSSGSDCKLRLQTSVLLSDVPMSFPRSTQPSLVLIAIGNPSPRDIGPFNISSVYISAPNIISIGACMYNSGSANLRFFKVGQLGSFNLKFGISEVSTPVTTASTENSSELFSGQNVTFTVDEECCTGVFPTPIIIRSDFLWTSPNLSQHPFVIMVTWEPLSSRALQRHQNTWWRPSTPAARWFSPQNNPNGKVAGHWADLPANGPKLPRVPGYPTKILPLQSGRGGAYIPSGIVARSNLHPIPLTSPDTAITSIAICLEQSIIVVHSAYWHGLRAADDFIPLLEDTIRRTSLPVILGMDTNAHSLTWGIGARLDFRGANLEEFASFNDFHFLGPPVDSTWSNGPLSSSIDVTLASSSLAIHVTRGLLDEMAFTDHIPIWTTFLDMVNNETKSSWVESSCKEQTFKSFLNSSLHQEVSSAYWSDIHRFIARGRGSPRGPPLLKHDNGSLYNPHETCQTLLNHFFLPDTRPHPQRNAISAHSDEPEFKPWEVLRAIHRCGKRKALGPDGLGSKCLDLGGPSLQFLLAELFTKCLRIGHFPRQWKEGRLILLPKSSNSATSQLEKYRPITLLNTMAKVFERCILARLQRLADRHGWFFEDQYKTVLGTVNGRSAEDALASITQLIEERQAHWRKTLVISSDISKAFDTVWRPAIIQNLERLNCSESITCLVKSFLEDRTVSYSAWTATECTSSQLGTPQGSALSPFLWNIVARTIFTLPSIIDSRLIAYADDFTLMTQLDGASAWGGRALSSEGIRQLRSLHCNFAKRVLRGGPYTPTVSAISITGSPPFDIIVRSRTAFLKEINEGNFESRPGPASLLYPPDRRQLSFSLNIEEITTPIIFTDGSKNEAGVGAAIVPSSEDQQPVLLRLHPDCTAFQAELLAIRWAVRLVKEGYSRNAITIASDCRSALSAICMSGPVRSTLVAKIILALNTNQNVNLCWVPGHCGIDGKERADRAAKNAAVLILEPSFSILPRSLARNHSRAAALDAWTEVYCQDHYNRHLRRIAHTPDRLLQFLPKVCPGEVTTTLLTGHGHVRADLVLWRLGEDPSCPHCMEEQQTVDHLLFRCPAFKQHRMKTALLLGKTSFDPVSLAGLPGSLQAWNFLTSWRMIKFFEKTGSLEAKPRSGRPSTRKSVAVTVSQNVEAIETLSTYGEVSARQVSRQTGISYGTVWRALRIFLKKYPYKIQRFHELKVGDFEKRQEFAAWVFRQIDIDENWLSNVLWTDEAHFSLNGEVNTQNSRIWATENPRIFTEMPLHQPRVTVWYGFTSSFIIGPFFFEEINGRTFKTVSVTGERYVQLLREKVIPILQDRQALSEITFMQDGGPPHISRGAKQLLKDTFGEDRVISRHFIHQWPSRSPDLTPCDFWLWGYIKSRVYRCRPTTLAMLKASIRRHVSSISSDILFNAVQSVIYRLQAHQRQVLTFVLSFGSAFWLPLPIHLPFHYPRSQHGQESIVECSSSPMIPVSSKNRFQDNQRRPWTEIFQTTTGHLITPAPRDIRRVRSKMLLARHDGRWHERILFTDTKIFTVEENINRQNDRIYACSSLEASLRVRRLEKSHHPSSFMGWWGVSYQGVTDLHFCAKGVKNTAKNYQEDILEQIVKPLNTKMFSGEHWTFQQDSAPAHRAKSTQQWLETNVPEFIKANECPSGSPDLNPLDYSVAGTSRSSVASGSQKLQLRSSLGVAGTSRSSVASGNQRLLLQSSLGVAGTSRSSVASGSQKLQLRSSLGVAGTSRSSVASGNQRLLLPSSLGVAGTSRSSVASVNQKLQLQASLGVAGTSRSSVASVNQKLQLQSSLGVAGTSRSSVASGNQNLQLQSSLGVSGTSRSSVASGNQNLQVSVWYLHKIKYVELKKASRDQENIRIKEVFELKKFELSKFYCISINGKINGRCVASDPGGDTCVKSGHSDNWTSERP
ncbi:hypothetical protein LAZ67_X004905, partial [Cordylochernes scorpioides]